MTVTIDGTTGVSAVQAGVVEQGDLAANVAGNGPAFGAYATSGQSITSATYTKVTFGTEEFDTNSNFASSTFTPTVAGYYQINIQVATGTAQSRIIVLLYKNGSAHKNGNDLASASSYASSFGALVYMNGSTDYLDVYVYFGTTASTEFGVAKTWFNGSLARSAV
jgi:hypothetical protein